MCGISAVYGVEAPLKALLLNMNMPERGIYGSGVAFVEKGRIRVVKEPIHPTLLYMKRFNELKGRSYVAIGHNRMPSVGSVCYENTHPFTDCRRKFALVHNGHIFKLGGNLMLKYELLRKGHKIMGQTDSELLTHVIEELLVEYGNMLEVLAIVGAEYLGGNICVLTKSGKLYCVKSVNYPLHYAIVDRQVLVASTSKAIKRVLNMFGYNDAEIYEVEDNTILEIKQGEVTEYAYE